MANTVSVVEQGYKPGDKVICPVCGKPATMVIVGEDVEPEIYYWKHCNLRAMEPEQKRRLIALRESQCLTR